MKLAVVASLVALKMPCLVATSPAPHTLDLYWQNLPGSRVAVFQDGQDTLHANTGRLEIVQPNWPDGLVERVKVCTAGFGPQVCTPTVTVVIQ